MEQPTTPILDPALDAFDKFHSALDYLNELSFNARYIVDSDMEDGNVGSPDFTHSLYDLTNILIEIKDHLDSELMPALNTALSRFNKVGYIIARSNKPTRPQV